MKVDLSIEYSAEANRPGETAADEERMLNESIRPLVEEFAKVVRDACESEGCEVRIQG